MSIRSRRALGALAATALSCLSVVGLQATAASAVTAEPIHQCFVLDGQVYPCTPADGLVPAKPQPDRSVAEPMSRLPEAMEASAESGRPITDNPLYKPIWCTDVDTGEVFQCGWQS